MTTELPFHRDRPEAVVSTPLSLAEIRAFDEVIDARSPAEYAEDHLPGAINAPVLDDAERALVGTIYKQRSAFDAKRAGAPLLARNVARHIESGFADRPKQWRPLVYCWRGGGRSGAFVHVLRQVGWDAVRLDGGYKAFRRQVVADLDAIPAHFRFHVICGATGSGKSRLLEALEAAGAQVLDLEALAAHRGSVLGDLPDLPQPSQKSFETAIWSRLSAFEPALAVFVESESRKVGDLRVPGVLIERMRGAPCLRVEVETQARVDLLLEDYEHLIARPDVLVAKLECLKDLHGAERIAEWKARVAARDFRGLVLDLLESHYDPAYRRSMLRNYRGAPGATPVPVKDISRGGFLATARELLRTLA